MMEIYAPGFIFLISAILNRWEYQLYQRRKTKPAANMAKVAMMLAIPAALPVRESEWGNENQSFSNVMKNRYIVSVIYQKSTSKYVLLSYQPWRSMN